MMGKSASLFFSTTRESYDKKIWFNFNLSTLSSLGCNLFYFRQIFFLVAISVIIKDINGLAHRRSVNDAMGSAHILFSIFWDLASEFKL